MASTSWTAGLGLSLRGSAASPPSKEKTASIDSLAQPHRGAGSVERNEAGSADASFDTAKVASEPATIDAAESSQAGREGISGYKSGRRRSIRRSEGSARPAEGKDRSTRQFASEPIGSPSQARQMLEPSTPRASTSELPGSHALSPSQGARSLIDPDDMIVNPFSNEDSSDEKRDSMRSGTSQQRASQSSEHESLQSELPADRNELAIDEATPSATYEQRFTTISLGDTANEAPHITDEFATAPSPQVGGDLQGEFLARQVSRLSTGPDGKRKSGRGHDLQERFNELREESHSRKGSLKRRPRDSASARDSLATASEAEKEEAKETIGGAFGPDGANAEEASAEAELSRQTSWSGPPGDERPDEAIDWDFWGQVMNDYPDVARNQPQKLSRAIQTGIPSALRGMLWQLMSSSKDEEMEMIYAYYLKQTSPHEKMIRKDLSRTFPGQDYFQDGKGIGQENMFNVMKAYSLYDEEVGYCQGMQFVVAPLLLNMPDEEAFSTLVRLMKSYDLRGHFVPNMPALQLRLFQFERLLEEFLPLLHRHLVRAGVKTSMYASGWLMTLFCYRSPLSICHRILDSVFAEGIEALFRFALALMKKNEEQLLNMEFDEAVPLLAARVFDVYHVKDGQAEDELEDKSTDMALRGEDGAPAGHAHSETEVYRVNQLVRDAFEFKITPFMLDSHAADFAEQVRLATAHRREVETLKLENRSLQHKVKSLEDQLGAVQQEHVDLVKSVVMAKIAEEEMAEELMKYKMMYAEAALLVDKGGLSGNGLTNISLRDDDNSEPSPDHSLHSSHSHRSTSHSQHSQHSQHSHHSQHSQRSRHSPPSSSSASQHLSRESSHSQSWR